MFQGGTNEAGNLTQHCGLTCHLTSLDQCTLLSLRKMEFPEAVLRWQRNGMGRPLSPPQIHQKNIWTPSKFHKTTSECWQRTSGTQKGSPLSSKGGRKNIKDKKRDKRGRGGDLSQEGSLKKERNFQTPGNTLARSVVSLGISEGKITGRRNK